MLQSGARKATSQLSAWLLHDKLCTQAVPAGLMACTADATQPWHTTSQMSSQEASCSSQICPPTSPTAPSRSGLNIWTLGWPSCGLHTRSQASWTPLPLGVRCMHGMHGRHGWALKSNERNRIIASLGDLHQLSVFWRQWGGDHPDAQLPSTVYRQPCRLDHLNLALFLYQLQRCCPPRLLHPSYVPLPAGGEHEAPADQQAAGGVTHFTEEQVTRVRELVDHVVLCVRQRSKLCDPVTASQLLLSLGKLGYQDTELIGLLVDKATARLQEAYLRDLSRMAVALAVMEYREGAAWWSGAWQQVALILPTTMFDPRHVHRMLRAGEQLGHPAPASVMALWQRYSSSQPAAAPPASDSGKKRAKTTATA